MSIFRFVLLLAAHLVAPGLFVASPIAAAADTAPQFREEVRDYVGIGRIRWRFPVEPEFGCGFKVPHFTQGPRVGCASRDGDVAEISVYARDLRLTPGERRNKFIADHQHVLGESNEKTLTLQADGGSPSIVYARLTHRNPGADSRPHLVLGYYVKGPLVIQFSHEATDIADTRLARMFSVIRSAEPVDALPMLAWKLQDYASVCAGLFPAQRSLNERAFAASLFATVDWRRHFMDRNPEMTPEQMAERLHKARSGLAESLKTGPADNSAQFCSDFPVMAIEAERGLPGGRPRGSIGVLLGQLTAESARAQGLASPSGALVHAVEADSPAQRAGLVAGDIILRLADEAVTSGNELVRLATLQRAGSTFEVVILRKSERLKISLTTAVMSD